MYNARFFLFSQLNTLLEMVMHEPANDCAAQLMLGSVESQLRTSFFVLVQKIHITRHDAQNQPHTVYVHLNLVYRTLSTLLSTFQRSSTIIPTLPIFNAYTLFDFIQTTLGQYSNSCFFRISLCVPASPATPPGGATFFIL